MLTNTMKEDLIHGLIDIFSSNILAVILYGSVARNEIQMRAILILQLL
jgi:hypothetical protein